MPQANPRDVVDDRFPLGPGTFAIEASEGRWKAFPHLILIIELLMYMVDGRFNRLMVFCPPRHGKSWLISKYFLTWFLGTFPDLRIILATHRASFSAKWGRITKQLLERYGKKLFVSEMLTEEGERVLVKNDVELDKSSNAAYRWDISGHDGGLFTGGIGTGLLGEGMNGGIIDDPTKGFTKANRKSHQQELNDWYYTEFKTRADTDLATGKSPWICYIAQRLNRKDLAGQILYGLTDEDPGEPHIDAREALHILRNGGNIPNGTWVVLNLPALAEENDILGRQPGEALCRQIKNESELEQIQREMGSFRFEALYQGQPREREGKIFKSIWFKDEHGNLLEDLFVAGSDLKVQNEIRYWDAASSGEEGDKTASLKSTYDKETKTLIFKGPLVNYPYSAKGVIDKYYQISNDEQNVQSIFEQEPGSGTKLLVARLRRDKRLKQRKTIRLDKVRESKADRAFDLEVLCEDHRVRFDKESLTHRDVETIINQWIEFTGEEGGEDHIVDVSTGSARWWLRPRRKVVV